MARHSTLTGADAIHQASYFQSSDPGAVGAGKDWWDTTADPPTLYRRNEDNDDWIAVVDPTVGAAPSGAAGGVLSGTYPNPSFAADMATQAELDAVTAAKANLASPTFTGTPAAPTATGGTNTTQIATTAFVQAAVTGGVSATEFTIPIQLGNGADAITTGEPEWVVVLSCGNFDITDWTVVADASGSVVVKIEKATYAAFPTWTEIMASERPTLSSARKNQDTLTTPESITTEIILRATIVSATTVKAVSVALNCSRV